MQSPFPARLHCQLMHLSSVSNQETIQPGQQQHGLGQGRLALSSGSASDKFYCLGQMTQLLHFFICEVNTTKLPVSCSCLENGIAKIVKHSEKSLACIKQSKQFNSLILTKHPERHDCLLNMLIESQDSQVLLHFGSFRKSLPPL